MFGAVSTKGSGQVRLDRCPKSNDLEHVVMLENHSRILLQFFLELSSKTPEANSETARIFSIFLIYNWKCGAFPIYNEDFGGCSACS